MRRHRSLWLKELRVPIVAGVLVSVVATGCRGLSTRPAIDTASTESSDSAKRAEPSEPAAFRANGRLVCLAEEMKRAHNADVPPVHDHVLGFHLAEDEESGKNELRYYTILRTPQSEALYRDERFRKHELILSGRVFPGTSILEVNDWRWIRDGKVYEVYYWCEICSIPGIVPGSCACCQQDVELREEIDESAKP